MAWKLACMLRTYRKCDPTVGFSKYEFNNKLLRGCIIWRYRWGMCSLALHTLDHLVEWYVMLSYGIFIFIFFMKIRRSQHAFINPAITIILRMGAGGHGVPPLGNPDG